MNPTHEEIEAKIALLEVQLKLSEAAERAWESSMMRACGEDGPKSVADKFAELESKLETALRECRSAGITIDNLEAKCAALTAENALMDELDKWKQESSAWQAVAEKQLALAEDAEKRITELEAREVVLPQCYSMLHRVDFDEPYHTEMVYRQHQVLEALHNAGINVTEAGKGEAL